MYDELRSYFLEKYYNDLTSMLKNPIEEVSQVFFKNNIDLLKLGLRSNGFCIPKFKFGNSYVSDFVIFNENTIGIFINLVELEPPTSNLFNKDGSYAKRLNGAIAQIFNWKA